MQRWVSIAVAVACWFVFSPARESVGARAPADDIVLREGLAIPPVGRAGRSPVHTNAIDAAIVAGKWSPPKAGDTVALPDGSSRTWQAIRAGDNGMFRDRALGGGYAYFSVSVESEQVTLLDAAGHSMVYVNGEPRTGDLYSNGWVRVPVLLRAGTNELLFNVARGELRAKLVKPKAAAQFDLADTTLPDLIVGQAVDTEAAVVMLNCSVQPAHGLAVEATLPDGESVRTLVPVLFPLGVRKVGFRLAGRAPAAEGDVKVELRLLRREADSDKWQSLDSATITAAAKQPTATHKRTFRSRIDGSVQYFAVVPRKSGEQRAESREPEAAGGGLDELRPALILTLHGAGVEAIGQANAYLQKDWAHVVAPTNRRPFGFDWEDWGRLDAIEVLELARKQLKTAPGNTYLTGHSMGGHGVWQIGGHFPDRFAAIGPSAGWVSMQSYAGARRPDNPNPIGELLERAASASDTLALARNYAQHGVYVLHGEKDDNVPVGQARTMKGVLERFHTDFGYHEEPGMGHWWGKEGIPGTACVDWPPMWEFFRKHTLKPNEAVREIEFVTVSPGVSAWSHWVGIEAQIRQFAPSSVRIQFDPARQRFSGTTENVARLAIDVSRLERKGKSFEVELDGENLAKLPLEDGQNRLWLSHESGQWSVAPQSPAAHKGAQRYGPFKDAFRNRVLFVYGTKGTPEENAWSLAKARYDAETFWYRGNGSVDVWSDTEFDAESASPPLNANSRDPFADRNVILYGNADSNSAWDRLLKDSPVQVRRSRVEIGDRVELGDDLACLFVRPRPDSDTASVGVVSGTGVAGMRLADRLPYFVSGVAYPDCVVIGPAMLADGIGGVRAAGFFGLDWSVASGEFVWPN